VLLFPCSYTQTLIFYTTGILTDIHAVLALGYMGYIGGIHPFSKQESGFFQPNLRAMDCKCGIHLSQESSQEIC